jgi:hypothetical protein
MIKKKNSVRVMKKKKEQEKKKKNPIGKKSIGRGQI